MLAQTWHYFPRFPALKFYWTPVIVYHEKKQGLETLHNSFGDRAFVGRRGWAFHVSFLVQLTSPNTNPGTSKIEVAQMLGSRDVLIV